MTPFLIVHLLCWVSVWIGMYPSTPEGHVKYTFPVAPCRVPVHKWDFRSSPMLPLVFLRGTGTLTGGRENPLTREGRMDGEKKMREPSMASREMYHLIRTLVPQSDSAQEDH